MIRPLRIEFPNALYHMTSRGDHRENIHEDDNDREKFMEIFGAVVLERKMLKSQCIWQSQYTWQSLGGVQMAGHSKWANIKFRKAAQDSKRGKLFTKLIREISISARQGGGDVDANPRLRTAIDKALSNNMTRDTVDRAIKRGSGEGEGADIEEIRYEGYAPAGVAVLVECATDNRNRTVGEVRHVFSKYGGNLGTDGSVAYLFNKVGTILYPPGSNEEAVMEIAIESGADDVLTDVDGSIEVLTQPEILSDVNSAITHSGIEAEEVDVVQRPSTQIELTLADAHKVMKLIDALEDLDDVQDVFTNASFPSNMEFT